MNRFKISGRRRAAMLGVLVIAAGITAAFAQIEHRSAPVPQPVAIQTAKTGPAPGGYADVIEKATPAVVSISTAKMVKTSAGFPPMDPFFRRFFGEDPEGRTPRPHKESATGSGVIVTPDGYILTNNHVVDQATDIRVTLFDRREFKARLVGTDPKTDIAVIKIDASGLPVLAFADSSKVRVGDFSIAIGNPFGIGQTVTFGIVSATGRGNLGIEDYEDFIQTDAAINPGNSGGALVNTRGDLIGVNTAIISPGGGNNGVGFAIPANLARNVMEQLVAKGKVTRAYLGLRLQPLTPQLAAAFGLKDAGGALVADVEPGGPAAQAGLRRGDVILKFNGEPMNDVAQLRIRAGGEQPGSTARLEIWRDGAATTSEVKLAEMPDSEVASGRLKDSGNGPLDGVELSQLDARTLRQLELPPATQGVLVAGVDPSSAAAEAGLRRGDIIQQVNRKPVRTPEQIDSAISAGGAKPVLLTVLRGGNTMFLAIEVHS
jgi:Do/DeqQ family serine protease